MKVKQAIDHFGSIEELAKAVGVSRPTVYMWQQNDAIPEGRQWQLQVITGGKLRALQAPRTQRKRA